MVPINLKFNSLGHSCFLLNYVALYFAKLMYFFEWLHEDSFMSKVIN